MQLRTTVIRDILGRRFYVQDIMGSFILRDADNNMVAMAPACTEQRFEEFLGNNFGNHLACEFRGAEWYDSETVTHIHDRVSKARQG